MTTKTTGTTPSGRKVTVFFNLPFEEYTALDGANSSRLKHLRHSPLAYYSNPQIIGRRSAAVGHMFHTAVLEASEFDSRYVAAPAGMRRDKRTAVYKEFLDTVPEGADISTEPEVGLVMNMVMSLNEDPLCSDHLDRGHTEVTIQYEDEETGVLCKVRLDHISELGITDLKSSKDPTPEGFPWECKKYGYFQQSAHYREAVQSAVDAGLLDCPRDYFLLACENTDKLFSQVLYKLHPEEIDSFLEARASALLVVAECEKSGHWPGPGNGAVNMLSYPGRKPQPETEDDVTGGYDV